MQTLKEILTEMYGSEKQALYEIKQARALMNEYLDQGEHDLAYDICHEMWGLEPDYLLDLI